MNVLMIGAHPDDIEIGCGGLTLKLAYKGGFKIIWLIMTSGDLIRANKKTRIEEQRQSCNSMKHVTWDQQFFSDNGLPYELVPMINLIEKKIKEYEVDMIVTHSAHDTHHDHRAVFQASVEAGRNIDNIICYEEIVSTVDFKPNLFLDIDKLIEDKIKLVANHASQCNKTCLNLESIRALARHRMAQLNQSIGHCEAFEVYKLGLGSFLAT